MRRSISESYRYLNLLLTNKNLQLYSAVLLPEQKADMFTS